MSFKVDVVRGIVGKAKTSNSSLRSAAAHIKPLPASVKTGDKQGSLLDIGLKSLCGYGGN